MEKNKEVKNAIVKTYAEDMATVIENDREGLVKKIIHGEEVHEAERKNLSPESKKNKLFMFLGILLIILSFATLFFFLFMKEEEKVQMQEKFTPIIFNDQSSYLEVAELNKDKIMQTVSNQVRNTKIETGKLEGIYLTENKQMIGLRRFIALIKSNFTPNENTLLVNDNFLMGVVNSGTKDFFILLKVRSTADIFDSLKKWEEKMFSDLYGFLEMDNSDDFGYLLTKNFEDGIVENKNSRILYDKENKIVLMYIYADENSVIITNTQAAAHEILLRLNSSQKKQ